MKPRKYVFDEKANKYRLSKDAAKGVAHKNQSGRHLKCEKRIEKLETRTHKIGKGLRKIMKMLDEDEEGQLSEEEEEEPPQRTGSSLRLNRAGCDQRQASYGPLNWWPQEEYLTPYKATKDIPITRKVKLANITQPDTSTICKATQQEKTESEAEMTLSQIKKQLVASEGVIIYVPSMEMLKKLPNHIVLGTPDMVKSKNRDDNYEYQDWKDLLAKQNANNWSWSDGCALNCPSHNRHLGKHAKHKAKKRKKKRRR